jgi:hypothetical protein
MRNIVLILLFLLLPIARCLAGELGVGSDSPAVITIPEAFHHEDESATTLFVMPRKNDMDGPISLRLSFLQEVPEANPSEEKIKELLSHLNPKSELLHFGRNLATSQVEEGLDGQGLKWRFTHYVVYADQLLFAVTVQTIESRDKEPQCHELLEAMPQMLASLKRKKS